MKRQNRKLYIIILFIFFMFSSVPNSIVPFTFIVKGEGFQSKKCIIMYFIARNESELRLKTKKVRLIMFPCHFHSLTRGLISNIHLCLRSLNSSLLFFPMVNPICLQSSSQWGVPFFSRVGHLNFEFSIIFKLIPLGDLIEL